jgi:putative ABC transport system substrate-binding protein
MTVTIPRRKFITILGSAAVTWPHAVGAQQKKLPRIGTLVLGNADAELFRAELKEGLRSSGYIEGQNVLLEFRSAEGKRNDFPSLPQSWLRSRSTSSSRFTPLAPSPHSALPVRFPLSF